HECKRRTVQIQSANVRSPSNDCRRGQRTQARNKSDPKCETEKIHQIALEISFSVSSRLYAAAPEWPWSNKSIHSILCLLSGASAQAPVKKFRPYRNAPTGYLI